MTRLRLSAAAKDDLRDIRIYSKAVFGLPVAKDYMSGLRRIFGLLRERPMVGASDAELGENMRKFTYRSHRVFYRVEGRDVLIVRILHHAQDARRSLNS